MTGMCSIAICAAMVLHGDGLLSDIEYANVGGVSLKLEAWLPEGEGPFPAVILVHDGGWRSGDKQFNFKQIFEPLGKAGFAWFSVSYRLAPTYRYPVAIDDLVLAIKYVEAHTKQYRNDGKRIAISGEVAGGTSWR